jgi:hypothetical protein
MRTLFEHVGDNTFKLANELNVNTYNKVKHNANYRGDKKGKDVESLADKRILSVIRKHGIPMKTSEGNSLIVLFNPNFSIVNDQTNVSDAEQWRISDSYIEQVDYKSVSTNFPIIFKKVNYIYLTYFAHVDDKHRIIVDRRLANEIFKRIGKSFVKVDPTFTSPNSLFQG